MNTTCPEIRALLADHLDGLLDAEAAAAVEHHVSDCAVCATRSKKC